jgi:predicted DNA-binding WGR domain protein
LKDWTRRDAIGGSNLALPFNKQDDVAAAALKLYRITGETGYRDRAARIFAFQKSRFQLAGVY